MLMEELAAAWSFTTFCDIFFVVDVKFDGTGRAMGGFSCSVDGRVSNDRVLRCTRGAFSSSMEIEDFTRSLAGPLSISRISNPLSEVTELVLDFPERRLDALDETVGSGEV